MTATQAVFLFYMLPIIVIALIVIFVDGGMPGNDELAWAIIVTVIPLFNIIVAAFLVSIVIADRLRSTAAAKAQAQPERRKQ